MDDCNSTLGPHRLRRALEADKLPYLLALRGAIDKDPNDRIVCDAANLRFVDPLGLCVLAATCHKLAQREQRLHLINVPPEIEGYLARMDLFRICGIEYEERFVRHDQQNNLLEVRVVDRVGEESAVAAQLATAVLGTTPGSDSPISGDGMSAPPTDHLHQLLYHVFSELLENALTHGRRDGCGTARAWAAAQYYPSRDRICIAVIDDGCGFLRTLRTHPRLVEKSHASALSLALEPQVSCNPDLDVRPDETLNKGVGLTVVREIAARSGTLRIVSGNALLQQKDGYRVPLKTTPYWGGVMLALDFDRPQLQEVDLVQIVSRLRTGDVPQLRFT